LKLSKFYQKVERVNADEPFFAVTKDFASVSLSDSQRQICQQRLDVASSGRLLQHFPAILKSHRDVCRFLKYPALRYPFPAQLERGRKPYLCDEDLTSMKIMLINPGKCSNWLRG
jgi:hypothetical protein